MWAISREKESDEFRSWLEEEKQKMLKKESRESSDVATSPLEEEFKNKEEETEESLESVPTSPLDPNWGKGLPAPTPVVATPFTLMWRPWEEKECRKGRGEAQLRQTAAGGGSKCGRRKWREPTSHLSCGQHRADKELQSAEENGRASF